MKYNIITDKDKYILQILLTHNPIKDHYELNLNDYDMSGNKRFCYKLIGNWKTEWNIVFDQNKFEYLEKQDEPERKQKRINELKAKLTETDYLVSRTFEQVMELTNPLTWIADVIKITSDFAKKYKQQIADRKAWREEIEELQK